MTVALPHPRVINEDGSLDPHAVQGDLDALALVQASGIPRIVSGGKKNIPGGETTASLAYTLLATPDLVTVALPTDGIIQILYQAIWQNTVASNARAAIFIGANQLKVGIGTGAAAVQEMPGPAQVNDDGLLYTSNEGLRQTDGVGASTEVTTGQVVGANVVGQGGAAWVFAAAGTYDVSIQFKNAAAGSTTASKRHLWVAAYAFA